MPLRKLPYSFYRQPDVLAIARQLLGKVLITRIEGEITSGRIVETEAYNGVTDRASHAWNGRRTNRTEIMYANGGKGYVFLCYGIHHLFNVVTNTRNTPHAALIRAVHPMEGIPVMMRRRNKQKHDNSLTRGPGSVSAALGINTLHTGLDLRGDTIWIADDGTLINENNIIATTRIGVDYAGADALLPWRFYVKGNPYVSRPLREK